MLQHWDKYYTEHFKNYKQESAVRDGCHPLIFRHGDNRKRNAMVLVHGLTDSPHFMRDIGEYFCTEMDFDVYIPLLRAHGLKDPQDMQDASLPKWKEDVKFAVDEAKKTANTVSIGGLSTGGTLSVELAINNPVTIDGGVFLFSAALGLATQFGNLGEFILRTPFADFFDALDNTNLVDNSPSGNPFRYAKMDIGAAAQLSQLIRELDKLIDAKNKSVTQPLFAAHSTADTTADIKEIESLVNKSPKAEMFKIGENFTVPHASVVLKDPVFSKNHSPLEPKNPFFIEMMQSLHEFAIRSALC